MIFTSDECPLCLEEKMEINMADLFECPKCHMQIAIQPMLYAIVLRTRGEGRFRPPLYNQGNMADLALTRGVGDGIEPNEAEFFDSTSEIAEYLEKG